MKHTTSVDHGYLALKYEDLKSIGAKNCAPQHLSRPGQCEGAARRRTAP
jgi:hypothetical protein